MSTSGRWRSSGWNFSGPGKRRVVASWTGVIAITAVVLAGGLGNVPSNAQTADNGAWEEGSPVPQSPAAPPFPPARHKAAAQMLGPDCGGDCGNILATGGWGEKAASFSPKDSFWDDFTPSPSPELISFNPDYSPLAVGLPNGKVLVLGRDGSQDVVMSKLYEPGSLRASGKWTPTADQPSPHGEHFSATLLQGPACKPPLPAPYCGKVLLAGGSVGAEAANGTVRADLYDPLTNSWAPTGPMTEPRHSHAAVQLADGRVLVAGGIRFENSLALPTTEVYDPLLGAWTGTGNLPSGYRPSRPAMALIRGAECETLPPPDYCDKVLLAGGAVVINNGASGYLKASALYDPSASGTRSILLSRSNDQDFFGPPVPAEGKWTEAGEMAAHRYLNTATSLPDGGVLVSGPTWNESGYTFRAGELAEIFDPRVGWTKADPLDRISDMSSPMSDRGLPAIPIRGNRTLCDSHCGKILIFNVNVSASPNPTAGSFFYIPRPALSRLVPQSAVVGEQIKVELFGEGLAPASHVDFGGTRLPCADDASAACRPDSETPDTQLHLAVPPHPVPETVGVTVTSKGGTSNALPFTFSPVGALPIPRLSSVNPKCGPIEGGAAVKIQGSGFTGIDTVAFGGVKLPPGSFRVDSERLISAAAPAHPAGSVHVRVGRGSTLSDVSTESVFAYPCPSFSGGAGGSNRGGQTGGGLALPTAPPNSGPGLGPGAPVSLGGAPPPSSPAFSTLLTPSPQSIPAAQTPPAGATVPNPVSGAVLGASPLVQPLPGAVTVPLPAPEDEPAVRYLMLATLFLAPLAFFRPGRREAAGGCTILHQQTTPAPRIA